MLAKIHYTAKVQIQQVFNAHEQTDTALCVTASKFVASVKQMSDCWCTKRKASI